LQFYKKTVHSDFIKTQCHLQKCETVNVESKRLWTNAHVLYTFMKNTL